MPHCWWCTDGELAGALAEAAELLALVAGQDVERGEDGVFRIARRVARDRVISTVDTEARHGHKSRARTFDGYKAHLAVDPDEELITNPITAEDNGAEPTGQPVVDPGIKVRQQNPSTTAAATPSVGRGQSWSLTAS